MHKRARSLSGRAIAVLLFLAAMAFPGVVLAAEDEKAEAKAEAKAEVDAAFQAGKKGRWTGFPIPISDPTLGSGLVGGVLYDRKLGGSKLPSSFGAAAFWTNSDSYGVGFGARTHLNQDKLRVNGMFGVATLNWDFFGVGHSAGSNNRSVSLNQDAGFLSGETLFRLHEHIYLGPQYRILDVDTKIDLSSLPINLPNPDIDAVTASLGAHFEWATKDNEFSATKGSFFELFADWFDDAFGSDFKFQSYFSDYNYYKSIKENKRHIFAVRGTACYATDNAPFYEQCSIGIKDKFRGYTGMRYIDQFSVTAQAEFRWEVVPRWVVAFFGGVAEVALDPGSLNSSNLLPAAGFGARYFLREKSRISMRLDLAFGEDEELIYLSIGEAF